MSEWIEYSGKICPVEADAVIDVRFLGGGELTGCRAVSLLWGEVNIVAYRISDPAIFEIVGDKLSAPDLLKKAAQHMADRAATYDKPEGERSMGKAVEAFNAITGNSLTEAEGWLLLQVLKDVRLWQRPGYHADSAEDCIAYSALKAEAKQREAQ